MAELPLNFDSRLLSQRRLSNAQYKLVEFVSVAVVHVEEFEHFHGEVTTDQLPDQLPCQ